MVDDLLTLASADDGGLDLRPEPADLAALAEAVVDGLRPLAADRDVRVELTGGRAPVQADPGRLERAIRNVVENAIEFSEPGGVVEVATAPGRVVVSDDGPGVPAELRERIFDRFFRVDPSRTRTTGGSGLGLAIAKEIVLAHGGSIRVEPRERGSAFAIELPQAFNVLSEPPSYGAARI
jgi:signal transduction histidine kinase